ncbi:hypothetical protein [Nocardioides bruguierae]|uniref:Uncharacterized protein n=1 Tax=Nocardioides bruguierae TaxID=2945102 RepID=A0A9X2D586_9ACTN|nr:hypothetical protein [Nocardioides bruguierae]MCL8024891.1 hypothetical protein [Nocardioides bruguierae]MCM0619295.1 hypothetical protein [Nocardioides bruguierae]
MSTAMPLVTVDESGGCALPASVPPGTYAVEIADGVVVLRPVLSPPEETEPTPVVVADPVPAAPRRDWAEVPAGTVLIGPADVGLVVMDEGGVLQDGSTPGEHLREHRMIGNAWRLYTLEDGRSVGQAYDAGEWV